MLRSRILFTLLVYLLMMSRIFGLVDVDMALMLDLKLFVDLDRFASLIDMQIAQGRASYLVFHAVDYLFVLSFYPLLRDVISRVGKDRKADRAIGWIALIAGGCDFVENLAIDLALVTGSAIVTPAGVLLWFVTPMKFLGIVCAVVYSVVQAVARLLEDHRN